MSDLPGAPHARHPRAQLAQQRAAAAAGAPAGRGTVRIVTAAGTYELPHEPEPLEPDHITDQNKE